MTSQSPPNPLGNHPDEQGKAENDDRWSMVLRVAASRHFARAPRLHDILLYICQRAIADPATSIKEYDIGCHALGRRPSFNPNEDNIVRVQIGHLRKKLDEYYSTDGKDETTRISIPKGTYVPHFESRPETLVALAPVFDAARTAAPPDLTRGVRWTTRKVIGLVLIGLAVGLVIGAVTARQSMAAHSVDPVLLEAWRPFSRPDANVLLSTATPLNMVAVPEGHQTYGSSTYPVPAEAYSWFRQHRLLAPGAKLSMYFTDNMLGIGTMNAVVTTVNTLKSVGANYHVLPERAATFSALRGRNAILFGAPVDSEAITRSMEKTPLIVDYGPSVNEFVIRDRQSGEMLVPQKDANGDFTESYGLVTVLDTRDSDRGRLGLVIFSGITSAGTHGAAEFFSSPRALQNLRGIFAREGINGFPAAYQVVVKCTFSSILLLSYDYHSHRTLQKD